MFLWKVRLYKPLFLQQTTHNGMIHSSWCPCNPSYQQPALQLSVSWQEAFLEAFETPGFKWNQSPSLEFVLCLSWKSHQIKNYRRLSHPVIQTSMKPSPNTICSGNLLRFIPAPHLTTCLVYAFRFPQSGHEFCPRHPEQVEWHPAEQVSDTKLHAEEKWFQHVSTLFASM